MTHIKPTDSHLVSKIKSFGGHLSGGIEGHFPPEPFWSTDPKKVKEDLKYFNEQIIRTGEELESRYSFEQNEALNTLGYLK